jgi:hypothetical protein
VLGGGRHHRFLAKCGSAVEVLDKPHIEDTALASVKRVRTTEMREPLLTVSPGSVADSEFPFAHGDIADVGDTLT